MAKHNSNADMMTAWQTPAGQLPLDVAARKTNPVTVHSVLAGAYKGRSVSERALLTHASTDGGSTALCRRVNADSLCDIVEPDPPTCPICLARVTR